MAKEENLIPFTERTEDEQREIARKGGIASGKVRQEKATMKKTLEMLLNSKNNKGVAYRDLVTLGLIRGAVKGNAQNYKTIVEVLGELQLSENTTPTLEIKIIDNESKIKGESE